METTNAFLGDQPTGPRPPNYEPAPGTSGGYPQLPANQPMAPNVVSVHPPKQPEAQNLNAYAVPDANTAPAVAPQIGIANQNQKAMPPEMLAGLAAQEMGMLASRLDERQFQAIAHTMQAHPVSQGIQQDVVRIQQAMLKAQQHMAGNAIASMLAVNTVIKLHLAYPQLPVEGIVNDVMGVVGHFKQNQDQPGSIQALPSQFMGVAASYATNYGNPKPLPPAAAPVALAPQGLEQAKPVTVTAPGVSHHQGMIVPPQQALQVF